MFHISRYEHGMGVVDFQRQFNAVAELEPKTWWGHGIEGGQT